MNTKTESFTQQHSTDMTLYIHYPTNIPSDCFNRRKHSENLRDEFLPRKKNYYVFSMKTIKTEKLRE